MILAIRLHNLTLLRNPSFSGETIVQEISRVYPLIEECLPRNVINYRIINVNFH